MTFISRRDLLKRVGDDLDCRPAVSTARFSAHRAFRSRTFTPGEGRLMDAIVARLIPTDELGPGATEAHAVAYIDRALGGALTSSRPGLHGGPGRAGPLRTVVARRAVRAALRRRSGFRAHRRRNRRRHRFHRQFRRVLRDGAEPHASGHFRRSVLRRQRQLRRLGSDRLSRRPDDGDARPISRLWKSTR